MCLQFVSERAGERTKAKKNLTLHSYLNISPFAFFLSFLTAWHSVLE